MKHHFIVLAAALLIFTGAPLPAEAHQPVLGPVVKVKYSKKKVDLGHPRFEYLNTARSSYVRGAWYDRANRYMIIRLSQTYDHSCRMPAAKWTQLRNAQSFGRFYAYKLKGHFDCRKGGVPKY